VNTSSTSTGITGKEKLPSLPIQPDEKEQA